MNLIPWRNAEADTKHDAWLMLVVHTLLFLATVFIFGVYCFLGIFYAIGKGSPPSVISFVMALSFKPGPWSFLILLFPLPLGWLDAYGYVHLRSRYGKKIAFMWALGGFLVLLSLLVLVSATAILDLK
jgi:hypothetical protein